MADIDYKNIYDFAWKYLSNRAKQIGLSYEDLQRYFEPDKKYDIFSSSVNLASVYKRLLLSLQNRNYMPNVIQYDKADRQSKLDELLGLDNSADSFRHLANARVEDLSSKLTNIDINKNKTWEKWFTGAIDGAKWLNQFKNTEELKENIGGKDILNLNTPQNICQQIKGIGFALACDFLKEIGFIGYGKPDVHLINIFTKLGLSLDNKSREISVLQAIFEMSKICGISAYRIDKIFWLIATENFYLHPHIKTLRDKFIHAYAPKLLQN